MHAFIGCSLCIFLVALNIYIATRPTDVFITKRRRRIKRKTLAVEERINEAA
jgi:F0F1-type ATP synthase membrane subunit b/b'